MKKNCKRKKYLMPLMFIVSLFAFSAVVMLLWNAIIPSVIGWAVVSYWQAMGLLVLCRVLVGFKGRFLPGAGHFRGKRHHHHHKFHGMSKEERMEYIRKRFEEQGDERKG